MITLPEYLAQKNIKILIQIYARSKSRKDLLWKCLEILRVKTIVAPTQTELFYAEEDLTCHIDPTTTTQTIPTLSLINH